MRSRNLIVKLNFYQFYSIYSGDGTLSVMDIRSKNAEAVAQSEDQEDELLSIVAIKGLVDFLSFLVESENGTSGWMPEKEVVRVD